MHCTLLALICNALHFNIYIYFLLHNKKKHWPINWRKLILLLWIFTSAVEYFEELKSPIVEMYCAHVYYLECKEPYDMFPYKRLQKLKLLGLGGHVKLDQGLSKVGNKGSR